MRTWRRGIEGVRIRPRAAVPGAGVLQQETLGPLPIDCLTVARQAWPPALTTDSHPVGVSLTDRVMPGAPVQILFVKRPPGPYNLPWFRRVWSDRFMP